MSKKFSERDIQRLIQSGGWRLTPATFAQRITNGRWQPAPHLKYIASKIASKLHQGSARLIVEVPPRHGKSELLSVNTPIWQLDRRPDSRIILASYGAELATDFGRRVRDAINYDNDPEEGEHLLNVRLRDDSQQVGRFQTTAGGAMYSVGVGGAITGRGADLLLIDDYLKNSKDAESPQLREDIYNWLVSTALTRLEPNGSAIILATRWNIDDLIGRLILMHGDEWEVIRIPALCDNEEEDPLGRNLGEALWPERYNQEYLESMKRQLGTYWFQSLYQQSPMPSMSGLIEAHWFKQTNVIPHPNRMELVRYWDLASSEDAGDYTVGVLMARNLDTDQVIVLDVRRGQWTAATVEQQIKQCAETDDADIIGIEEEPGSAGKGQISHYQRHVIPGYPLKPVRPTGKKKARAQALLAAAEAGNLYIKRASWNREFIDEFLMFPDGEHDDQVDAASQAFNIIFGKRYKGVTWGRDEDIPSHKAAKYGQGRGKVVTGVAWGR